MAQEPPVLGRARLLKNGTKVAILSTGEIANEVMRAVEILNREGILPVVYQFHTVKPLDEVTLVNASKQVHTFIVVDEHLPNGSLWSYIAGWKAATDNPVRIKRLGPPDQYALGTLDREEIRRRWHYDADAIVDVCREMWKK